MAGPKTEKEVRELEGDVDIRDPEAMAKEIMGFIGKEWATDLLNDARKAAAEEVEKRVGEQEAKNTRRLPMGGATAQGNDGFLFGTGLDASMFQSAEQLLAHDPRMRAGFNPARFVSKSSPARKLWQAVDAHWDSMGEFLLATAGWGRGSPNVDQRLDAAFQFGIKNALNEGTGSDGGFLVPEEFRAMVEALTIEGSILEPLMMRLPMTSESLRLPYIRDESHADGTVFGGIKFVMVPEGGDVADDESEPTFADLILRARKLMGYTEISNDLLKDSAVALESFILQKYPQAHVWKRESLFINGSGNGQPQGVVNADAFIKVTIEPGQALPDALLFDNLNKIYSRMLPTSRGRAVWLANYELWPQIAKLSVPVGTGGSAVFITGYPPQTLAQTPPATIYGRPLYLTEHCPAAGTPGDIMFIDPSYIALGDREDLEISSSPHVKFTKDRTVWKFLSRFDARPWISDELIPEHGTATLSPFVGLDTRS